jgi:hypothetical protein
VADSNYNGYSWKQREALLRAFKRACLEGMIPRQGPCEMCGDPDRSTDLHSEDYSEPHSFQPPESYLICKACHLRLHKRFNERRESWLLFLSHLGAGGYGSEFTKLHSLAQRRLWLAALAAGEVVNLPSIRSRDAIADTWWERLTLDPVSLTAAWARPRPFRPRPSVAEYKNVLAQVEPSENELALLRCHAASPNYSASMRHLARQALQSDHPSTANLIYGSFAQRIGKALPDWKPDTREDGLAIWMSTVAEGWQPEQGEFEWVLIPQLRNLFSATS